MNIDIDIKTDCNSINYRTNITNFKNDFFVNVNTYLNISISKLSLKQSHVSGKTSRKN